MVGTQQDQQAAPVDWSQTYRRRLLVSVRGGLVCFLMIAGLRAVSGQWFHALNMFGMWCLTLVIHRLLQVDQKADRASWMFIIGLWLLLVCEAVVGGMSRSISLWTMGMLPILTAHLTGSTYVIQVGGVAVMTISCITGLDMLGINASEESYRDPHTDIVCVCMTAAYCHIAYTMASSIDQKVCEMNEQGIKLIRTRFEADRSSMAKSAFLANMSQEIRQPLKTAIEDAGALCATSLAPREVEAALSIQESSRRIWYIVNDIVEVSNMETGAFRLGQGVVRLSEIQARVQELSKGLASKAAIDAQFLPVRDKFGLTGDAARIERMLTILVHHAIASAESAIEVEMSVGALDRRSREDRVLVEISVQNDGSGAGASQTQGMFLDLRSELDDRMAAPEIGLGLSMVQRICRHMNGELTCAYRPGESARMRLRFELRVDSFDARTQTQVA